MQASLPGHARGGKPHTEITRLHESRTALRRPYWIYHKGDGRAARPEIKRGGRSFGACRHIHPARRRHLHRDGIGSPRDDGRTLYQTKAGSRRVRTLMGAQRGCGQVKEIDLKGRRRLTSIRADPTD